MTLLEQMQEIETAKNNIKHSLELKGKNPNDDIRTYSAIINSMDGDVPSAMKTKIIIQDEEPDETIPYEGIWIKSNTFTYENVYAIYNREEVKPSGVNIIMSTYRTKLNKRTILLDSDMVGGCYINFVEVLLTDENNDVLWEIPVYYGDDELEEWVDITAADIRWCGLHIDYVNQTVDIIDGSYDVGQLNCYKNRLRCNLDDSGVVQAYIGDDNYTDDGGINLQVMVEQPVVYVKMENITVQGDGVSLNSADYFIADGKKDGYELHPAFIVDNFKYRHIYLNAYQGTVANNKMCSYRTNATPLVNVSGDTCRTYAQSRGQYWRQWTFLGQQLELLLTLFEYKTFNLSLALAHGRNYNNGFLNVGSVPMVNLDENGTGYQNGDKTANLAFTYRYRENIYGNGFIYLDGINDNSSGYLLSNSHFVSNATEGIYKEKILNRTISTTGANLQTNKFFYINKYPYLFLLNYSGTQSAFLPNALCGSENHTGNMTATGSWYSPADPIGNLYSSCSYNGSSHTTSYYYGGLMCYPENQIDYNGDL